MKKIYIKNLKFAQATFTIFFLIFQSIFPLLAVSAEGSTDNTIPETPVITETPLISDTPATQDALELTETVLPTPTLSVEETPVVTETVIPTDNTDVIPTVDQSLQLKDLVVAPPVVETLDSLNLLGSMQSFNDIQTGITYNYALNNTVAISFSTLPQGVNSFSIEQKTVTVEGQTVTGYEFLSNMVNGSFAYTLTLPNTLGLTAKAQYSEDGQNYTPVESDKVNVNTVEIYANHFTIFTISADTTGGTWTSIDALPGNSPSITESAVGQVTPGTLILYAPVGYIFNTSSNITASSTHSGSCSHNSSNDQIKLGTSSSGSNSQTSTPSSSHVQFNVKYSSKGSSGCKSTITFTNIEIRPSAGTPLASATFTLSGTASLGSAIFGPTSDLYNEVVGAVSSSHSTISAVPSTLLADDTSTSIITITAKDKFNNPISGTSVTLTSNRGSHDTIMPSSHGTTDNTGEVIFTVKSHHVGEASLNAEVIINSHSHFDLDTHVTFTPAITISNPNTLPALTKTITASSSSDSNLYLHINAPGVTTCDHTLSFTSYHSITFNSENDNGKTVCYKAVGEDDYDEYDHNEYHHGDDDHDIVTYKLSNPISAIDTTFPVITIINPDTTPAQSKDISASTDEGILSMFINEPGSGVCDNSLTFIAYTPLTFTSEDDNGKTVCYKAVDEAGNTTYKLSDPIYLIDTTAPTVSGLSNTDVYEGDAMPVVSVTATDNMDDIRICFTLDSSNDSFDQTVKQCSSFESKTSHTWDINALFGLPSTVDTTIIPEGSYTFTYWSEDLAGNKSSDDSVTYNVLNSLPRYTGEDIPDVIINEGQSVKVNVTLPDGSLAPTPVFIPTTATVVATFEDPASDDAPWTAAFNFDSVGNPSNFVTFNSHTYLEDGTYIVTIKVTESPIAPGEGQSGIKTFKVIVNDVVPSVTTSAVQNSNRSFTFTANATGGNPPLALHWTGDCSGSGLTATTSTTPGTYTCTVTATDSDGDSASSTISRTITNVEQLQEQVSETTTPTVSPSPTGGVLGLINQTCDTQYTSSGYAFIDANNNGIKDNSEQVLSNVEIGIYVDDTLLTNVKTDNSGMWSAKLCPGDYKIKVTASTLPSNVSFVKGTMDVKISNSDTNTNINIALSNVSVASFPWWILILIALGFGGLVFFLRRRGGDPIYK